jgi:hypothetical protein
VTYAEAEKARLIAGAAASRSDYVHGGRQALVAADAYRRAESEARAAAAAAVAKAAKSDAPPAVTASSAAASPAPTPENPAVVPGAGTLAGEQPGIMRALQRYQDAHSAMSVTALREVYPTLPEETNQRLVAQFRGCRAYDVSFGNDKTVALDPKDPTTATVTTQAAYVCVAPQPTNRIPDQRTVRNVFSLRKTAGLWLIERVEETARR